MSEYALAVMIGGAAVLLAGVYVGLRGGARAFTKNQKFKGFGLELDVAPVTLVLLLGFAAFTAPLVLNMRSDAFEKRWRDEETLRRSAERENERLKQRLDTARQVTVRAYLEPQGVSPAALDRKDDWLCQYLVIGEDQLRAASLEYAAGPGFAATLDGVTLETQVKKIVLTNTRTNRRWESASFAPLGPVVPLALR